MVHHLVGSVEKCLVSEAIAISMLYYWYKLAFYPIVSLYVHLVTHIWNCVAVVVGLGSMYHAGNFKVMESIRWNNCWNTAGRCAMKYLILL